jgi:hypothetical protein
VAFAVHQVVERVIPRRWRASHRNGADANAAARVRGMLSLASGLFVSDVLLLVYAARYGS